MTAIQEFIGSNVVLCFLILAFVYAVGDWVGTATKAWVPSTFVVACLFIAGYWTIFPKEIVTASGLSAPFTTLICVYLLIVHMGSSISLRELLKQWKVIVTCLAGLAGYPLTAFCLKKEGRRLLAAFRSGKLENAAPVMAGGDLETVSAEPEKRRLIPPTPKKYFSTATALVKISLVTLIGMKISALTGVGGTVCTLLLSIALTELGFLEKNILKECGCFNLTAYAMMMAIFDGLKGATPEIMSAAIGPMLILIVIGVLGMGIMALIVSKLVKMNFFMAMAVNLTALYGFPPNYILTEEACTALAENDTEKNYLMEHMLPQMIVGGFVTVTITSVVIAGVFAGLL